MYTPHLPVIFGLSGLTVTPQEEALFAACKPAGFILFQRNCQSRAQVRALTDSLRAIVGATYLPILIDQEGGRVARLKPPEWPEFPSPGTLADAYAASPESSINALKGQYQSIARLLREVGVTVNCMPVLDIPAAHSHAIIGDRALGATPGPIIALGRAVCEAHLDEGVEPILKHIPGHGRALVDSHEDLPVVTTGADELALTDFAPFKALADSAPWAMTAHIVYTALDEGQPATLSHAIISNIIRGQLGFNGLILSDDLNMKALRGTLPTNTAACLAAGCDVALHCSGNIDEMQAIAATPLPAPSQRLLAYFARHSGVA
jgi:beta-N-acetylhexosaminidase